MGYIYAQCESYDWVAQPETHWIRAGRILNHPC